MDSGAERMPDSPTATGLHWVTSTALVVLLLLVIGVVWLMVVGTRHGPYNPNKVTPVSAVAQPAATPDTTAAQDPAVEETAANPCDEPAAEENPCDDTQDNPSSE